MKRIFPIAALHALALGCVLQAGCGSGASSQTPGMLRVPAATGVPGDITVRNAHLVPADPDLDPSYGIEPGGGVRTITEGVRIINMARGASLSARDRLPQAPNPEGVLAIPARMGGGFFYLIGTTLWRSDSWLSKPVPVFQAPQTVTRMFAGLDRVYMRTQSGAYVAVDPKDGKPIDLGALPGTPYLGKLVAVDGWHAVAIADLRGVVSTDDAGVTWRTVKLPIEPNDIQRVGDSVLVGSATTAKGAQWFEVQRGGFVTRAAAPEKVVDEKEDVPDAIQRVYGRRPLRAAVEDGWPLGDGSAVVARDGELARIRLSDGVVLEHATGAFPLKPSRCHPVALGNGGFGFACGEPHGATAIYQFNQGKLDAIREFDGPRRVLASGNGSLVVHGGCDADATSDDARSPEHVMCVRNKAGDWRDVRIKDPSCVRVAGTECEEYARDQRVVALASGALVVLSPPQAGRLEGVARLTVLEPGGTVRTVPLVLDATADTTPSVLRVLRLGMWMDGFEEREPNVIAGWVELAGILVGVKIKIDGHTRHGLLLHDGGTMLASGKWALGFSGGRRGYESVDGGMTWAPVDLPDAIDEHRVVSSHACGPVGCAVKGWIRIGWGAPPPEEAQVMPSLPTISPVTLRTSTIAMTCDVAKIGPAVTTVGSVGAIDYDGGGYSRYGGRYGYPGYGGGYGRPKQTYNWTPFFNIAAPKIGDADAGFPNDAADWSNTQGGARFYAWGPKKDAEWDVHNRWVVRWLSPFASSADVKSSPISATPRSVMESSGWLTLASPRLMTWKFHGADDAAHGLLVGRQTSGTTDLMLMELEDGRAPAEVRRADGEPFAELESAVRASGRWFVSTQQNPGQAAATVVWEIDGGIARELVRLPRALDGSARTSRLARRADGRAIGVVVDGQPSATRYQTAQRWVAPVDIETGAVSDPELLGPIDLADRPLPSCKGDEPGWLLDVPFTNTVRLEAGVASTALSRILARLRLAPGRSCIDRLSGTGDLDPMKGVSKASDVGIEVAMMSGSVRHLLRCTSK